MVTATVLPPQVPFHLLRPRPTSTTARSLPFTVVCGPRSNRGPLVRGRILSTEAILAIQSLKRAARVDASALDEVLSSNSILRLLKPDLLAALSELQRQDLPLVAHRLFLSRRHEFSYPSEFYAGMIAAFRRAGMATEIDAIAADFAAGAESGAADVRGVGRVVRALLAARRGEAAKAVYEALRRGGREGDEYLVRALSRGLRLLGDRQAAEELERRHAPCLDRC